MRSGILIHLIVVGLCVCATAAVPPVQPAPGDILILSSGNPAVRAAADWDVAAHLEADWEYASATMTSRLYNPAVRPEAQVEGPEWSLAVSSIIDITNSEGLVAWSQYAKSATAYDKNGQVIANMEPMLSLMRWYERPESLRSPMFENRFQLNFPIDSDVAYPDLVGKIDWTLDLLLVEKTETVDIPFEPNDTWVEVTPGFEVLVEMATAEEGKYEYRIKFRCDNTKVLYAGSGLIQAFNDNALPPAAVFGLSVLNSEGQPYGSGSGGFGSSGSTRTSGNQTTGTLSGDGRCNTCGDAKTIRYTVGSNLYEQEASFTLTDIPVPTF